MAGSSWDRSVEERERETEKALARGFRDDRIGKGWSERSYDPVLYTPPPVGWQAVPILWRFVIMLAVLALAIGGFLYFLHPELFERSSNGGFFQPAAEDDAAAGSS